ncbi:hypothetical protein LZ31DRAFT_301693 [Colletotrichum somersetense]|nr:hypothetical protein LZ31DRAFT_301693 [Colletotrichum somersetense]
MASNVIRAVPILAFAIAHSRLLLIRFSTTYRAMPRMLLTNKPTQIPKKVSIPSISFINVPSVRGAAVFPMLFPGFQDGIDNEHIKKIDDGQPGFRCSIH